MSFFTKRILRPVLFVLFLMVTTTHVHPQPNDNQAPPSEQEPLPVVPELSSIVPLASTLPGRLKQLEASLHNLPDFYDVEREYTRLNTEVDKLAAQLEMIRASDRYNWVRLDNLYLQLGYEKTSAEKNGEQLAKVIDWLAEWKTQWQTEQEQWNNWQLVLLKDRVPSQLRSTFYMAKETIDTALNLVTEQLDSMMLIQQKGGEVRTKIDALESATSSLISQSRQRFLFAKWPPLLSSDYFSQFEWKLWLVTFENLNAITWPDRRYFIQHRWLYVTQFFILLVIIFNIHRNREAFSQSEYWRFLAVRPVSAALLVIIILQLLFLKYLQFPVLIKLFYILIGWFSLIRLLGVAIEQQWKRKAAFWVITFFIITLMLEAFNFPLPFYRLYIFIASLTAFFFCLHWRLKSSRKDSAFYAWTLNLGSLFLGIIVIAQLWDTKGNVLFFFKSLLVSMAIIITFTLFIRIIRGGLHWLFFSSPIWEIKQLRSEADRLARRIGLLVEIVIWGFGLLPIILTIWGVYLSVPEATTHLLSLGFNIGHQRMNIGLILTSAVILYCFVLLSWVLPKVLLDGMIFGKGMERGVRISVGRIIQYSIIFIGLVLTLITLGLDFTKITIILSALGVGIGFGLQGIVNNFINGLVMLFEQPARVGDIIEVKDKLTEIKRIGLRSTTVQTLDKAEIIISNADLLSKEVVNWTLSNRQIRLTIPVGVAYGSNVPLVFETLLACAEEHKLIAKSPPPQVLFLNFGENSLGLELRVWIKDADHRLTVTSDLHQEIERKFREAKINIAFPQRDLHLRSIDSSIVIPPHTEAG